MKEIADFFNTTEETVGKILASVGVIIFVILVRSLVLRTLQRRFEEAWVNYRAQKVASYISTLVIIISLAFIWISAFNDLATFLGLISAGIAIGLSDVLKNMAGWIYILSRRPFRVGDRIEVDDTKGDVVDIRLFRFSLMEVGNWVDANQSTGRLVHVPNGIVFTNKVANYTEGFEFIWHEIPILVTFESDRQRTKEIINAALDEHAPKIDRGAASVIRETANNYHIRVGALTPIVYMTVRDSGVLFTARFMVNVRGQRGVEQSVWNAILEEFDKEPRIDLAYPTVRTYFQGPIQIDSD